MSLTADLVSLEQMMSSWQFCQLTTCVILHWPLQLSSSSIDVFADLTIQDAAAPFVLGLHPMISWSLRPTNVIRSSHRRHGEDGCFVLSCPCACHVFRLKISSACNIRSGSWLARDNNTAAHFGGHLLPALTDNQTRGAASRHTTELATSQDSFQ